MRWAAALLLVGCGGGLAERAREAALEPPHGDELAVLCNGEPFIVTEHAQEDLWGGRGRRGRLAPPPEGSVVNEETGELVSLPPQSGRYFTVTCDGLCIPPTVLVHCDTSCTVIGENLLEMSFGTMHCPEY